MVCPCCGCNGTCVDPCGQNLLTVTYFGETLSVGQSVAVPDPPGDILTTDYQSWDFSCTTFNSFSGLVFSYEKRLADCEEEWSEVWMLSCNNGVWVADIYRYHVDREQIMGSACNDEFAPFCEKYWFDVLLPVGVDCLPTGDVLLGSPDQVFFEGIEQPCAVDGGTFDTISFGRP